MTCCSKNCKTPEEILENHLVHGFFPPIIHQYCGCSFCLEHGDEE